MSLRTAKVTQVDLDRGEREEGSACPVARALRRATHHKVDIFVGINYVEIGDEDLDLSPDVYAFVRAFDRGRKLRPMTVQFRGPRPGKDERGILKRRGEVLSMGTSARKRK